MPSLLLVGLIINNTTTTNDSFFRDALSWLRLCT